jgi:hypothetical protein
METILQSAILVEGKIWTGNRHHNVIHKYCEQTENGRIPAQHIQGFVTSHFRFVDREEGARIALEAGQISELSYSPTELFSEDIWHGNMGG